MCKHNEHNHQHNKSSLKRTGIAFIVFITVILSHLSEPVKFSLFFLAYLLAGGDILLKAFRNIIKGKIFDENFLMSIATLGAFAIKEYPEAVMVMVLYQIGEYFQHMAVAKSRNSITALMDIRPDYANIEKDNKLIKCSPNEVKTGNIIVVNTGEKIPLDGIITEGKASIDTSALTGESVPREIKAGDEAISGFINLNGCLKIRVTKPFGESTVSKILEMVQHAVTKKATAENFITRFAAYYTPLVVAGAVLLAVLPPLLIEGAVFSVWLERALTFLVISCPCALVISIPLSFFGIRHSGALTSLPRGISRISLARRPPLLVYCFRHTSTHRPYRTFARAGLNGGFVAYVYQITE